ELELARLDDWQFRRLRALEDAAGINADLLAAVKRWPRERIWRSRRLQFAACCVSHFFISRRRIGLQGSRLRPRRTIKIDYCFDENNCLVSLINNNKFILDQSKGSRGTVRHACRIGSGQRSVK